MLDIPKAWWEIEKQKIAAKAINKNVSEWAVRRALHSILLVSAVKQKKPALPNKNVKASLQFYKKN